MWRKYIHTYIHTYILYTCMHAPGEFSQVKVKLYKLNYERYDIQLGGQARGGGGSKTQAGSETYKTGEGWRGGVVLAKWSNCTDNLCTCTGRYRTRTNAFINRVSVL